MVTAPHSGAEVIPFIKTYVNLPVAILFTGLYANMTDRMELKNVFYACVLPFLAFFASFAFFMYPQRAMLHPNGLCNWLGARLPLSFAAPLAILRNWSFALFYVMAEMWYVDSGAKQQLGKRLLILPVMYLHTFHPQGQCRRVTFVLGICE